MIVIEGPLCFAAALLICGAHVLYLRSWRREQRQRLAWWQKYDADAQKRHDTFMRAMDPGGVGTLGWNHDGSRERGQA